MKTLASILHIEDIGAVEFLFESVRAPISITDHTAPDEPIIFCNQAFIELTGYTKNEIIGRNCRFLQGNGTEVQQVKIIRQGIKDEKSSRVAFKNYRKDGSEFINDLLISPIKNDQGLVTHFIGMQMDVSKVVKKAYYDQQMRQMHEQQKRLEAVAETKDEFISIASHQLQTPSSAVKQYLGLLIEGHIGSLDKDALAILRKAYASNERQITIINTLLQTAHRDAADFRIHKTKENVATIVDEAIQELSPVIELRDQTIEFEAEKNGTIFANVDRAEFKTAIVCLLENASKYSHDTSKLRISLRQELTTVELSFSDQGVGIKDKDLERIFEKFTRVPNDLSDTVSGTGLGLYWAKRIVTLHGGTLTVSSVAKKGTTFKIKIPA